MNTKEFSKLIQLEIGFIQLWILTFISCIMVLKLLWKIRQNHMDYINEQYRTECLVEQLIIPFQWRAKYLYKKLSCNVSGCGNTPTYKNSLVFCDKHLWVFESYELRRHYDTYLPSILLIWNNAPQEYIFHGLNEVLEYFPRISKFYNDRVEKIMSRKCYFGEAKQFIHNDEMFAFQGYKDTDYYCPLINLIWQIKHDINTAQYISISTNYTTSISNHTEDMSYIYEEFYEEY